MTDFPPAPWRMRGPGVVVLGAVPLRTARALVGPGARVRAIAPGFAAGAVMIADYRSGSALRYGEVAGLIGPVFAPGAAGGWVDSMLVDSPASRAGGRQLWNVPKELAGFDWRGDPVGSVEVRDAHGGLVVRASWRPVSRGARVPIRSAFLGGLDGGVTAGTLKGALALAPRRVRLEIPDSSPLARLRLSRARLGFAGTVDVFAGLGNTKAGRGTDRTATRL